MKSIVILAATEQEIKPTLNYLYEHYIPLNANVFIKGGLHVAAYISLPGMVYTLYTLGGIHLSGMSNHLIHAGIAGAYDTDKHPIGSLVQIESEAFGDLGVEDKDGSFTPAFAMGLLEPNSDVCTDGWMYNEEKNLDLMPDLPRVKGISVNRVSGSAQTISQMKHWYSPDVETMESAAFFFYCLKYGVPFNSVRAISNKVEPRDRSKWNIPLAIQNLNDYLLATIKNFEEK